MAYDKLTLLNPDSEESVRMVCIDEEEEEETFILISEPNGNHVWLDKEDQPMRDYINQLRIMRDELNRFISYLEHDR